MKIKINNIFKNMLVNKKKISLKRRKNIKNISKLKDEIDYSSSNSNNSNSNSDNNNELDKVEDFKEVNKEKRRKGASNNNNIFNMLKTFIYKFKLKRNYYILFGLMSILAVVSVYTNFLTYKDNDNESYEVFNSNDESNENQKAQSSISEELQDLNSNNIDTRKSTEVESKPVSSNVATSNKVTTKVATVVPLSFVKPIKGEIIKVYSEDKLLFSKTLESWKTHDGIDIKANIGENVISIEKGIIEKVYEDSFLGMTVMIDHGQGYKSIYSNLDSSVNVKEKQIVKKSAVIGKLGTTAIGEIKDESHIHFMLMLNNKVIDPTSKIKF